MTKTELEGVVDVLGGKRTLGGDLQSRTDFIKLSHIGIPKTALIKLADHLNTSMNEMAKLVDISERTIQRKTNKGTFNKLVSERILNIAEVVARGDEVFGDRDNFLIWLHQPSLALGNRSPFSLLDSGYGTAMVLDEIGRIEHGVFA